jgi:hypothetical protein
VRLTDQEKLIKALVAAAPPLSDDQRRRLATVLRTTGEGAEDAPTAGQVLDDR